MRLSRYGILLIGFLLLCTAGVAAGPVMHLETDTAWLVAGSGGTSTVTVTVTDAVGAPLAGQSIALSCDLAMGAVSPSTVTTGTDGRATATFRSGTMSGTATITATAEYPDENNVPQTVSSSCEQLIDHTTPYRIAALEYESEIMVGSATAIVLAMEDRYGNRVDARRVAETVRFQVGSPGGRAGISDGSEYRDDVVLPVDENGDVRADFRADQIAGENIIYVTFPGTVPAATLTIYGIGNAVPASIACSVSPYADPVPWIPADGTSRFTLTYTLKDAYGNPAGARSIRVATSLSDEEPVLLTSNSEGLVMFTYGPKDTTGRVTITATSKDNPSVTCSQAVEFTNTAPVNMLLSANPQSMPSRDVKDATAEIRAKVMDEKGNRVMGETVTFSLSNIDTTRYSATAPPELVETSATTDGNGYAVVHFKPGAFTRDRNDPAYSPTATGTCDVVAVWGDVSHTLPLAWKNYPYLSVSASVDPETVEVNDTVNVSLTLKGDGWALQPDPIDVVLVVDRSGSMRYRDSSGNVRITSAKTAASTFIDQMNTGRDRVGLVSFSSSTTLDNYLTDDFASVKSDLQSLQPEGATQLRRAIYEALRMQQEQGRPEAVRAVIVMTDGDWNYDGSPLGHGIGLPGGVGRWSGNTILYDYYEYYDGLGGTLDSGLVSVPYASRDGYYYRSEYERHCHDGESTNQNMSRFALSNDVKLYAITFAYDPSSTVTDTMTALSTSTGGFYEHAPGGDKLAEIYTRIASDLKTEAGVDTMMDISFENVEVNDAPVPGEDVFAYQYIPGVSTNIASWIDNETGHYDPVPLHTEDRTADWEDDRSLHFAIGTVHLGQTWTASYTLKVLHDGNINVFGSGSTISFNGGAETLALPDTFITAIPDLNSTGIKNATLDLVEPLRQIGSGPVTDFLKVGWRLNYTGNYTAAQKLSYSTDRGKTWTHFLTMTPRPAGEYDEQASLDVRSLAAGKYLIRVYGTAPDAPNDGLQLDNEVQVGSLQSNKIRLE